MCLFFHGARSNDFLRHVRITKLYLLLPSDRSLVKTEAKSDFGITQLQNRTLLPGVPETAVMPLREAHRYVINLGPPKGVFFAFYSAAARLYGALKNIFTALRRANQRRFSPASIEIHAFLQYKRLKSKTRTTTVLPLFPSLMQVHKFDVKNRQKLFATEALCRQ